MQLLYAIASIVTETFDYLTIRLLALDFYERVI